jgi:O-antigen/teichoic acid export membrane protein
VLSVERVAFVWAGPTAMALMMTGNDRPMLLVTFLAGAVQIAATWVGAMTGGILGAGIGFLFGSLLRTVVLWDQARRATGLRTDLSVRDLGRSLALVRTSLRGRRGAGPGS